MDDVDWFEYFDRVGARPNSIVTGTVRDFVKRRDAALDLGSGNFRDSRWLKNEALFKRVVAVDPCEGVEAYLHDEVEFHPVQMQDFHIEECTFDLIVACNALFYIANNEIFELIPRVMRGLTPGGVFAFNVVGKHDCWITDGRPRSWLSEEELATLVSPYEILGAGSVDAPMPDGKRRHMYSLYLTNLPDEKK